VSWKPTHQHYKGGLYRKIAHATHTERDECLTIYEDRHGNVWARPTRLFEEVLPDGRRRFKLIAE
jgi:hypothetical protein